MHLIRSRAVPLAVLILCVAQARAAESGPAPSGFEVAFRTGVQIPAGDTAENSPISWYFGLQFPLWLDLGYRLDKLFIGAYGQYTFGIPGSLVECSRPLGVSCTVEGGIRTGFEAQFHPLGRVNVDPWIGLAFGYEWQTIQPANDPLGKATIQGWELARVGLGCDFAVSETFRLGPFAEFSIDEFVQDGLGSASYPIDAKALHFWISVGIKVTGLF